MNELDRKPVSGLKIAGIVIGALVAVLVILAVVVSMIGNARIARLQASGEVRLAAIRNADPARPTLRGTSEPGNAWDDYAKAMDAVKAYPAANKLYEVVKRDPKADPELGKAALTALAPAIDHVHRGAGRAASRYPYDWSKGLAMPTPNLTTANYTASLVVLKARSLAEEGKGRESAGVLLDGLQFGRDMSADGVLISEMVGYAMLAVVLEEIREQVTSGKFDKAALGDLERGLAALEPTLPDHARTLLNDVFLLSGLTDPAVIGSWGPQRLVVAKGIEETDALLARAATADGVSWAEAQKVQKEIEAETQKSWNPITKFTAPSTLQTSRNIRVRRAQIRMLRSALHQALTGELLDLDDPFGAKLKTSKTGEAIKLWSVGPDGIDDGGTGEWKPEGKDIVLELKK